MPAVLFTEFDEVRPAPSRPSLAHELRAYLELRQLRRSEVYKGTGVAHGDGAPVLLIPGFLGSDRYLRVLHDWLDGLGYRPSPSGLRIAAGAMVKLVAHVRRRVEEIASAGDGPVTLIGHSLGGVLGRMAAAQRPDLVAHVVTLGSPLRGPHTAAHPFVTALRKRFIREGETPAARAAVRDWERELLTTPLPQVRLTSIYSRQDAVVDWRACVDFDPGAVAYEVQGTHIGLVWNAQVYELLRQALRRPVPAPDQTAGVV